MNSLTSCVVVVLRRCAKQGRHDRLPTRGNPAQAFYLICLLRFLSQSIGNALTTSTAPVVTIKGGKTFANSRDVAEYFGKAHFNILQIIDNLLLEPDAEDIALNFQASVAEVGGGFGKRHIRAYDMNRDGFTELVMGFTGTKARKFKRAYFAQFNAMEAELKRHGASDYGASGLH